MQPAWSFCTTVAFSRWRFVFLLHGLVLFQVRHGKLTFQGAGKPATAGIAPDGSHEYYDDRDGDGARHILGLCVCRRRWHSWHRPRVGRLGRQAGARAGVAAPGVAPGITTGMGTATATGVPATPGLNANGPCNGASSRCSGIRHHGVVFGRDSSNGTKVLVLSCG
jgi:hypothetical protein